MAGTERSSLCSNQNPLKRPLYGSISSVSGSLDGGGGETANKWRSSELAGGLAHIQTGASDAGRLVCAAGPAGSGQTINIQSSSDSLIAGETGSGASTLLERAAKRVPCLGIIFALCASIFLGSAGMLVKMTHSVHGVQVAVFRALIQAAIYSSIILFRKLPWAPARAELKGVLGRALFGASSITFSYNALKLIPLADATTIRFSMPIWTLLIGYLVLREEFGAVHLFAVVACISGVALIAKPDLVLRLLWLVYSWLASGAQQPNNDGGQLTQWPANLNTMAGEESLLVSLPVDEQFVTKTTIITNETVRAGPMSPIGAVAAAATEKEASLKQFEGTLLALGSSVCLAISLVCLRLCKETKVEITILWLSLASVLIGSGLLVSINEWRLPDNWPDVLFILLNGLFGSIGQWFITNALKIEQSGVISLTRTADIQVAFLYGALLLHEPIKAASILGSLLVTLGVVAVALPKLLAERASRAGSCWLCWCCCCCRGRNWTSSSEQGPRPADIEVARAHLGDIPSIGRAGRALGARAGGAQTPLPAEGKDCGKQLAVFVA